MLQQFAATQQTAAAAATAGGAGAGDGAEPEAGNGRTVATLG